MNGSDRWASTAQGVLRIVAGLLFWQHGAQKLFGWLGGTALDSWFSWPMGASGLLEFFGGLLVLVGFKTRYAAFILSGEMAVTYWWMHFPRGLMPVENSGDLPVLFCFTFLFLWAAGPGRFSVDGMLAARGSALEG